MTVQAPVSLDHYISANAKRRKESVFKLMYRFHEIPGIQDISAGFPHASLFPLNELNSSVVPPVKSSSSIGINSTKSMLSDAQQYGLAAGMPELRDWINTFMHEYVAKPLYEGGYTQMATNGSTDGLHKTLQVLSDEWSDTQPVSERQGMLAECMTYAMATEAARTRGLNVVDIEIDNEGMLPLSLESTLKNWDVSKGKRPHLLYTVSIGQNPTGSVTGLARRKELYEICCKYDVVIIEDEPYWYMQYGDVQEKCFLNIDREGRVIRLDSFSKNFAPGTRLGWVSGPPKVIKQIYHLTEECTMHPSGLSQLLVYQTLSEWGHKGWVEWLEKLTLGYKARRDLLNAGIQPYKCLPSGEEIIKYDLPKAGMFIWTTLQFDKHPLTSTFSNVELGKAFWIHQTSAPHPTLVTPGYFFDTKLTVSEQNACYFRLSFSASEGDILQPVGKCFGEKTHSFWELDEARIRQLITEYPADI